MAWQNTLAQALGRPWEALECPQGERQTPMDNIDAIDRKQPKSNFVNTVNSVNRGLGVKVAPAPQPTDTCILYRGVATLEVDHRPACELCAGLRAGPERCDWAGCPIHAHVRPRATVH